jgi:hypothetical protein
LASYGIQGKDPAKVRAGRASAAKRWGSAPRVVRLDALTPDQRRLVLALINAASHENAAADVEGPAAATEVRRVSDGTP